jgi:hypothetical protein
MENQFSDQRANTHEEHFIQIMTLDIHKTALRFAYVVEVPFNLQGKPENSNSVF